MVRIHEFPLGPWPDQLRAGRGVHCHGDLCDLGAALRTAALLLLDRGPVSRLDIVYQRRSTAGTTTSRGWTSGCAARVPYRACAGATRRPSSGHARRASRSPATRTSTRPAVVHRRAGGMRAVARRSACRCWNWTSRRRRGRRPHRRLARGHGGSAPRGASTRRSRTSRAAPLAIEFRSLNPPPI